MAMDLNLDPCGWQKMRWCLQCVRRVPASVSCLKPTWNRSVLTAFLFPWSSTVCLTISLPITVCSLCTSLGQVAWKKCLVHVSLGSILTTSLPEAGRRFPFFFFLKICLRMCRCNWSRGLTSWGGDVAVYVFDIDQPSLSTPFNSIVASVSVFMALSTIFHSINSPDNSPLSHSVLSVLILPSSFQLYISLWKSFSALKSSFVVDWA